MPTTTLELVPSVVAVAASHVPVAVAVLWKQLRPRYHLPRRGGRLRESREWSIDNRLCLAAVGSRMSCDIGVCTRVPWLGAVDSGAVAVRAVSRARVCELTCVACHESRPRPACQPAWRHTCETPRLCVEVGTCWRCFVYGSMNIPVHGTVMFTHAQAPIPLTCVGLAFLWLTGRNVHVAGRHTCLRPCLRR